MAYNLRSADRDQQFLMPPDVREWLRADHLAWFILEVVEGLDLSAFYGGLRPDGRGGAAYDPKAMVAVTLYAYCVGDRSSRRIERRLVEDVAYRVLAANATPDHATVARFRAHHEAGLEGLFAQVLGLCVAAGMVKVGVVAVDGTKIAANAAKGANMDHERLERALREQARRILAEAAAIDAAEDALYGDARGDELPPELADRSSRLRHLREAKARLEAAQAERDAAGAEQKARQKDAEAGGRKRPGRKRTKPEPETRPLLVNATDPDSRLMKSPSGFCQGYNAQVMVSADQVVVAAEVSDSCVDVDRFVPMLDQTAHNLDAVGLADDIATVLADAGYYSADNATHDVDYELLIATAKSHKLPTQAPPQLPLPDGQDEKERAARQAQVFERMRTEGLSVSDAAALVGLSQSRTEHLRRRYRAGGVEALVRRRRANGEGSRALRFKTAVRRRMEARLASEDGRALYRLRGQIAEPVFGQIKEPRGFRRFSRRGLDACRSEWSLMATTHNLLKLWRNKSQAVVVGA